MEPRPDGRSATLGETYVARQSSDDFGRLISDLVVLHPVPPFMTSGGNQGCPDMVVNAGDHTEIYQMKTFRRRFKLTYEREALREAVDDYRATIRRRRGVVYLAAGSGKSATIVRFLADMLRADAPYDVVVTRVDRTSPVRDNSVARPSGRVLIDLVGHSEGFLLHVSKSAALKRVVMGTRTFFVPLRGLMHAAARSLAPPGRVVAASPHPTRGPGSSRMTADLVIRGMSFA
ncbi:hypothetical protein [Lentzea albida]|uniref:hypothetical protein n=1 Tax=Lentzea albida TaxID=65499 RepID=UPI001160A06E|nr:hypothetical protein [Lentzea albida]